MDNFKEKYKHIDADSLAGYGLLSRAKKSGWICPICDNGAGPDGTGVDFSLLNDGYRGYCHRCGHHFDVFELIAHRFNLNVNSQFPEVMKHAKEIFGDAPKISTESPKPKPERNYAPLISRAANDLPIFFKDRETWRGLTLETLQSFNVGYMPQSFLAQTPRIIIPDSPTHFLARYPFADEEGINPKPHFGRKKIFGLNRALDFLKKNPEQPVFAVEGEIDAMSIFQAGFPAIAFGGSHLSELQRFLLDDFPKSTKFILMFDNDETGRKKAPDAEKALVACGFDVTVGFLDEQLGDFNAFMQNDPSALKKTLREFTNNALREKVAEPKSEDKANTTDSFIPNCPISLTVPHGFAFRPQGIFFLSHNKKTKETSEIPVSYTPVVPIKTFRMETGGGEYVTLAIYERFKNSWRFQDVPQTVLARAQEVISLAGYGVHVNTESAKKLSTFLTNIQAEANNPQLIPRVTVYEQPGWTDDSCSKFRYPPGDSTAIIRDGGFNYAEKFSSAGDKADWLKLFFEAYENSVGVRYAVGLACAAPLVKLCKSRNLQGVLIAPSGSGKSAIARLATSIFGNPEKLHETLGDTGNFIGEMSPRLNDLFCWLDEYQVSDERLRRNFQQQIFRHAEGKTRGRLDRNAEMKPQFTFRGTRLLTAEQNVLMDEFTQGAFNRLIELQANDMISNELAVKIHQQIPKTFGHYGALLVNYYICHKKAVIKTYEQLQTRIAACGDFLDAHVQHLALVYTGLCYFMKMLEDMGDIKITTAPAENPDAFHSPILMLDYFDAPYFEKILPTPNTSNNLTRSLAVIAEFRFTYSKRFLVEKRDFNNVTIWEQPVSNEPVLGVKFLNGDFGFYPTELKKLLQKENFPPLKSLMRDFADKGLILTGNSKARRDQLSKFVDGANRWLYYFPRQSFVD